MSVDIDPLEASSSCDRIRRAIADVAQSELQPTLTVSVSISFAHFNGASLLVGERSHRQRPFRMPVLTQSASRRGAVECCAIHAVRLKGRSHAAKAQIFIAHLCEGTIAPPYWNRAVVARAPESAPAPKARHTVARSGR